PDPRLNVMASLPTRRVSSPSNTSIKALPVLRKDLPRIRGLWLGLGALTGETTGSMMGPTTGSEFKIGDSVWTTRGEEVIELDDSLRWAEVSQSLCINGIMMSQSQTVIEGIYLSNGQHVVMIKPSGGMMYQGMRKEIQTKGVIGDSIHFDALGDMQEFVKMLVSIVNQQVKAVTPNCETCGGPHSFNDCPAIVGQTQKVYAAGAYQELLESKQESRKPSSAGNNQGRNQFFQGASHGQNPPPDYQALAYQALVYQAPVHQP
nr:hypothetical protein [Tanacetum cinerariifolium]